MRKPSRRRLGAPNYAYPDQVEYAYTLPPEKRDIHLAAWAITVDDSEAEMTAELNRRQSGRPNIFIAKSPTRRSPRSVARPKAPKAPKPAKSS